MLCVIGILIVFIFGYSLIIFEHNFKINKASAAIFTAVICWSFYFIFCPTTYDAGMNSLTTLFSEAAQIVFFLLGAMTIVELIDSHKGFKIVTDFIQVTSKKKMLWVTSILGFILSSVLDNLTSTIVMVSLLRKLIPDKEEQKIFASMMVIATNAGGAWTPIGDVTTTMLWINGQISTLGIMKAILIPSIICLIVPVFLQTLFLKGNYPKSSFAEMKAEPKSKLVFWLGIGALVFVPIFKEITGLPPFMGILLGLSIMWIITDLVHHKYEERQHLRVHYVLRKVDVSGALFFLGILLAVSSLEVSGILEHFAKFLSTHLSSIEFVAGFIGILSAIIDNVPLVAATMGMYNLTEFPQDHRLWELIAYAAGTGGSILVIGSAAGVALMGLEKVTFIWYLRRISWLAFIGYLAGFGTYLLLSS